MKTRSIIQQLPAKGLSAIVFIVVLSIFPILSSAQTLTFTSSNPAIPASGMNLGITKQIIYQCSFAENVNNGVNITNISFTPTGTFVIADLTNYAFYCSTTNLFSGATLCSNVVTPLASGNMVSITALNPWVGVGQTGYCWITADISPTATPGHTLTVGALTAGNFVFSPIVATSGTMYAGGTQTIINPSTEQFRSINSGNWNVNSTWQQSADGGTTWVPATSTPTSLNGLVTIQSGNTVSLTAVANASSLTINGSLDVSTFALNGTNTLTVSSTGTLLIGGTSDFPTGFTTITLSSGSTVNYYLTGAQTVSGRTYSNLTLSGSGVKTTTTVTVSGILSMEGTATVSAVPTYGAAATLHYNTATSKAAGAEWLTPFVATGGVYVTNTGTISLNAAKVFNASVPLTINSGASLSTSGSNYQLTFGGNFVNGGTFTAGSSNIVIANTMATQSIAGFTSTGTVSMTKTAGTATFTGNVNGGPLTINGNGGTLNLGAGLTHTFTGIWTRTNGTLNGGSSTFRLGSGVSGTVGTFTAATGTVEYYALGTQTVAPLTYNNLTLSGTSAKTTTGITVNGILSMEGTATANALPTYGASATLQYKGSSTQTTGVEFPATWTGSGGIKIENANGVTLNAVKNTGTYPFTIGSIITGSIFNDGGYQLTGTGTLNLTSGTFKLGSTTATAFPAFGTNNIAAGTTVEYAATATQTVRGIPYSNLTISGTGTNSKTAGANITVNGILNLNSSNASATQGSLEMSTFTLLMGATATTAGTGDVTGIVNRTSFVVNTPYSFGNQFTTLNLQAGGALPTSVSFKVILSHSTFFDSKTTTINRYYDIIQTGGNSATLVTLNLHYLSSELNGTTEGNLDLFDYHVSQGLDKDDHGHSNYNTTNKWVGLTNIALTYIAPQTVFPSKYWTLGTPTTPGFTWLGANSTNWNDAANWVGGIPGASDAAIIPDAATTIHSPTLPAITTIGSISIQSGGILNDGGGSTLTISGAAGAWNNLGTFNPGTSTIIFTNAAASISNTTNFYNVTVANGANLTPGTNNIMRIAGTFSLSSTGILNAANNLNTIEYNGSAQPVINPNGSTTGYSNLILSGSGTKTMPASPLTVNGDFTLNGTTSATAANALTIIGNVILNSGTFNASTFTHSITGNWTNNGVTFTPSTGTINFNNTSSSQSINGTATNQTFNTLTLNKTAQTLNVGGSTTTLTLNGGLTITTGTFNPGTALTVNIAGNWANSGTFTSGSGTVDFNGSSAQTISGSNVFNNLTVNNSAGVAATTNQTVNGTLYLQSANASSTVGGLNMVADTLFMNANATNTGTGDITGIIKRKHTFIGNTIYTFGNPFTSISFTNVANSVKPVWISCKVTIGTAPGWMSSQGVNRIYSFATDGTGTDRTITHLHYLDSELNGSDETKLDFWDAYAGPGYPNTFPRGKTNYDVTNNWIGLGGMAINFIAPSSTIDYKQWGLAYTNVPVITWTGNGSPTYAGDWSLPGNWNGGVPTANDDVLIPSTLPGDTHGYPTCNLNSSTIPSVVKTLQIGSGASVTVDNYDITIYGSTGAWINNGTFTPGTGNVIFNHGIISDVVTMSGTTNFNNVIVSDGTDLALGTNNIMRIAGTLSLSTTGVLDAALVHNTIEYNGVNQTLIIPNGSTPGFSDLILSNSGIKTLPAFTMPVNGNFYMSGTASVTALEDINFIGNVTIGSGNTFNASAFTLNVGGNWTNSGTFNANTSTLALNGTALQTMSGTNIFNNLTINNTAGVGAVNNQTVNGVLNLQSDNASSTLGTLDMGTYILDMGGNATTIGTGDVTGIVRRLLFTTNVVYTFGNQFTSFKFPVVSGQTLPTMLSMKIRIGTAPTWTTGISPTYGKPAIKRIYEVSQTGGTGTKATFSVHYLESELNGNQENLLTGWTHSTQNGTGEQGRANIDIVNDWASVADANIAPFNNVPFGYIEISLAEASGISTFTWNGSSSIEWVLAQNWTPNSVPSLTDGTANIIIPDAAGTPNILTVPLGGTIIKTLSIENGGVLNSGNNSLTITGTDGAWLNQGTFNAGIDTVTFTGNGATYSGTSNFYNLVINSGADLENRSNSILRIGNTVTNNGIWDTALLPNTVEFNGTDQTVYNTNGSNQGFYNLILSGSGTKTMPESVFSIAGDFTVTGAAIAIADSTFTIGGNLTIDNGATFNAQEYTHSVSGNWTNNGTFTSIGTINLNGNTNTTISGSNFNHLTISGSGTKSALTAVTVNGNFNIISGQFILNNATSNDITIAGDFSQTGGVFDFNSGTSGSCNMWLGGNFTQTTGDGSMTTSGAGAFNATINFNGSGTQTLNVSDPFGPIWVGFSIPSGKNVQCLSDIALVSADGVSQVGFQGEVLVNGTLDMGTHAVYQAGGVAGTALFTLYPGATLITSNAGGISGAISSSNMTNIFSSSANYEFRGASTGTFTTTPTSGTVNNLTINNSSGVALTNSINVAGLLSLTNGTLNVGGNTLTISGGSPSITSGIIDASATNSTVSFAGSTSQIIPFDVFYSNNVYNLDVNNSNNVVLNGSLNLLNTLTVTSGRLDANTNSPTVSYSGIAAQTIEANQFLNGQIYNLTIDNAAGVTLNDSASVDGTLLINNGKNMVISSGAKMTAQLITNNADVSGLTIKTDSLTPNGTLIFHNTSGNPVLATVEMYSKASWDLTNQTPENKYKWQFFGIPLSSVVTSPTFDGAYVRQYNETGNGSGYASTNRWIQLINSSTLTPFSGYEIVQSSAKTYTFQGQLINSDFSQTLSYTPGANSPGQHILSNPYTAAIDIRQLSFGNDFDKTVYIYNTGSLADWTGETGSGSGESPGQYVSAPQNTAGIGGIPGQIPSMQGFLIMINTATPTSTTFGIPYSSVATRNKDIQRVRALSNTTEIFTRIDVSGTRYSDKMWIITNPTCTRGYDNGWDGYKLFGSTLAPQIWAIEAAGDFQVDALDDINNTYLGFMKGEDTNYKMTFTNESLYSNYPSLYLVDSLENTLTDITESGTTYSFTADQTPKPYRRFKIVTSPGNVTNTATIKNSDLTIFSSQQTIFVQNQSDLTGSFMLYSISGQLILEMPVNANALTTIPTNLPAGTYIARVKTNQKELIEHVLIR